MQLIKKEAGISGFQFMQSAFSCYISEFTFIFEKSTYINIHTTDEKAAITIILKMVIVVIDTFNSMAYQGNIRRNNKVFIRERQTDRQTCTDRQTDSARQTERCEHFICYITYLFQQNDQSS